MDLNYLAFHRQWKKRINEKKIVFDPKVKLKSVFNGPDNLYLRNFQSKN